ncbi:hypothetical protein K437DRAFT_271885 [Tilletiaria anomala UBC 951]|uniref:Rad21/Rec8-like protein N-terminal domain-containing protein n=1 Tax=Tilletiaria anomala (strain ATCC 24038 / CBS 436.72 / UBC 951) TaxID=1037660 RepID=A0A066WGH6_TILAU|nr:uncharacterized protein K437DRAFT_271885 [Tilletiaria anomala UBC 951]KDN53097.1 hypothetical protein K437DRAFT_271885 [Tilletiaria anomala UBC 951]
MFYSDSILSKRGPLARVWLAAHWERKISKTQFLQTNIEKSVGAIVAEKGMPMALRLSGQLLLGVVRIYSRKARYLLEDCNEAILKIKMAFRTGTTNVDLNAHQLTASKAAITMPDMRTEFDLMLPDPFLQNWDLELELNAPQAAGQQSRKDRDGTPVSSGRGAHTAKESDITLPRNDFGIYDDDLGMGAGYGFLGDGINSQDFDPDGGALDLGLDLDDAHPSQLKDAEGRLVDADGVPVREDSAGFIDDSLSIGVGRDAAPMAKRSLGSLLGVGSENDRASIISDGWRNDELPPLEDGPPYDYDELPLMEDLPDFYIEESGAGVEMSMGQRLARSVTPATQVGDDTMALLQNVTPNTLGKMKEAASKRMFLATKTHGTKAGQKGPLIDSVIEMQTAAGKNKSQSLVQSVAQFKRPDGIVKPGEFLPADPEALHFQNIERDPIAYYLPELVLPKDQRTVYVGPTNLAPELQSLFTFDLDAIRQREAELDAEGAPPAKRRRTGGGEEDEDLLSEVGRRDDSRTARRDSLGLGAGFTGDGTTMSRGGDGGYDSYSELPPLEDTPYVYNDELPPLEDMPDHFRREGDDTAAAARGAAEGGEQTALRRSARGKTGPTDLMAELGQLPALSRLSTPELDLDGWSATASNPLGGFEGAAAGAHDAQFRSAAAAAASTQVSQNSTAGWSRNTVRALSVVRSQLMPSAEEEAEAAAQAAGGAEPIAEKMLSFEKVSENSSRRAAAAFFFEMLALGTKDCIKLKQEEAYGDIHVTAKDRLWDIEVVEPAVIPPPAQTGVAASNSDAAAAVRQTQSPSVQSTPRSQQQIKQTAAARSTPARSVRSATPRATPRATPALV